jgi:hypothetical protein
MQEFCRVRGAGVAGILGTTTDLTAALLLYYIILYYTVIYCIILYYSTVWN